MLNRREAVAGLTGLLATTNIRATALANDQNQPLRRGINASHWFAQSVEGDSPLHYARFMSSARMAQLARCGFDHVRLPIEPTFLFEVDQKPRLKATSLRLLHAAVDRFHSQGLRVVLDLHPVGAAKDVLLTPAGAEAFVQSWRLLAAEFSRSPGPLFLEVLNEPFPLAGTAWWSLQGDAIRAMREESPQTIIANGGNWSNIEDLVAQAPYSDANVIYTVHYYAPILFTSQSSEWGWDVAGRVANLGWPLSVGEADVVAAHATKDDEASHFVRDAVASGSFTSASMRSACELLTRWQESHGLPPIYVGEFGVVSKAAPSAACVRWLRAARQEFEARGWGWAVWDLSPSFGLLQPAASNPYGPWTDMQLNVEALRALGMNT